VRICIRCKKEYDRNSSKYLGSKRRGECPECSNESRILWAHNFIRYVRDIQDHAIKNGIRFRYLPEKYAELKRHLGYSRNDVRSLGKPLKLVSMESLGRLSTADHFNGMTHVITMAGMNVINGKLKNAMAVLSFIAEKDCTITVSKTLNQLLKKIDDKTPALYYDLCDGILENGKLISKKTFIKKYGQYFI
jgi:DNA-directed RNA polymerase subunit RPC12/RpoP